MKRNFSIAFPWLSSLTVSGILIFSHNQVLAQVTPDNTLGDESSVVNLRDATTDSIDGGAIRGQNLFHSFKEFNVSEDRGVYFANPEAVTNIFSRVTGNDVSNILGTLGVDGAANLFLINPNGIIFGEGTSLDVQGSFAATTADGIEFGEQGFFSASEPESPSLLTINPSAYLFNQVAPGAIANNSRANNNIGLQVQPGKSLSLIGGDVSFNGGNITAPAGNVDLGGLSAVGTIDINSNGSLSFPESVARGNVFLTQAAFVDVSGTEGGNITVNAGDLEISSNSELQTGTFADTGLPEGQSGDIILNATGAVEINASTLDAGVGTGNAGNIEISATSFSLTNDSEIINSTFGQGNAGNITIDATEDVSLNTGDIFSNVESQAEGNAGEIAIFANSLSLSNGAQIQSGIVEGGLGNGGNVNIDLGDTLTFSGKSPDEQALPSGIFTDVESGAEGEGGDINIKARSLSLTDDSKLNVNAAGEGNAGNIVIDTERLIVSNGANIKASTFNAGSGGNINIQASESVKLFGQGLPSLTGFSNFAFDTGDAGNVEISTKNFILQNGAVISTKSVDEGRGGNITINATESIQLLGGDFGKTSFPGFLTGGGLTADTLGKGKAGNIDITTGKLILQDQTYITSDSANTGVGGNLNVRADNISIQTGSSISASTTGLADAGNITISAKEINVDGLSQDGRQLDSNIATQTGGFIIPDTVDQIIPNIDPSTVSGKAGNITINTERLVVSDQAGIRTFTFNAGSAGNLNVRASDSVELIEGKLFADTQIGSSGNAGELKIETQRLSVRDGGQVGAGTFGEGQGGRLEINASDSIELIGTSTEEIPSGLFTSTENSGQGGELNVTTKNLNLQDDGSIFAGGQGTGNAGDININVLEALEANNGEISTSSTQSAGGAINITAGDINLRGSSDVKSNIFSGAGGGGNINITADSIIAFDDSDIFAFAADGRGGNITLDTPAFFAENFTLNSLTRDPDSLDNNSRADLNATGAVSGSVAIPDVSFIQNSLTELEDNSINTDELVANSCVSPVGKRQEGKFIITGTGGLPVAPGNNEISDFATGEVRNVPSNNSGWQRGEPIVEPQGIYRLTNGKLVMSRECR
jgi:filamentous hemagglutinin family protein